MKNLVVYLSPVEKAQSIIDYSIRLARQLQLNIHFICNIDVGKLDAIEDKKVSKAELSQKLVAEKRLEIEAIMNKDEWEWGDITAEYSIFTGSLRSVLKTADLQEHSKLVLLPVAGKATFSEQSVNSILGAAKLPVWCFKIDSEYRPVKTITYGSDYKKQDINVIKSFTWMAKAFKAKVNILHVYSHGKFKQQLLDAGLRDIVQKKIKYSDIEIHSKKKGSVVKGIAGFCEKSFADLLILFKKDEHFFQHLLRKSTVEKALEKLELPVLIYQK